MPTADYSEILEKVKTLLGRMVKSPACIEEQTELVNDLGLDSLLVMEIVQELEDTFDISFPLNELSRIRTLQDLALQIQQVMEVSSHGSF
jgi:acyl carrier protein